MKLITAEESASLLMQTIRPNIIIPDHIAESDVLMAIRNHIETDRCQLANAYSRNATNLIEDNAE
jgi:hypothetical protein